MRLKALKRALVAGAVIPSLLLGSVPAHAWKPSTHIYLSEAAIRDMLDDGKVTIHYVDPATGQIAGVLGHFDVDPDILRSIRNNPKQFRAGVLGPDAYPDILTGQQIVHPHAADAIDAAAGGSNAWLTHLWKAGFRGQNDDRIRAFVVGYLAHAAGDVFAHSYVNYYTGGEFQITPEPTNGIKHIVLEGYMGKRTPKTIPVNPKLVNTGKVCNDRKADDLGYDVADCGTTTKELYPPVSFEDTSIAGVEGFIHDHLVKAAPGSVLEQKLLKGSGVNKSVPAIFSKLRNGLQSEIDDHIRTTGSNRTLSPGLAYKQAWIRDIDAGLLAWPATSHAVATKLVYSDPAPADLGGAIDAAKGWESKHLMKMVGVPDAAVATGAFISDALSKWLPLPLLEGMKWLQKQGAKGLVWAATDRSADEWQRYFASPEENFDDVLNKPGGENGGVVHQVTLRDFNREQLKIADTGFANPAETWVTDKLPPAFNTLQLTKLALLGKTGIGQFTAALAARGMNVRVGGDFENAMLGWLTSLDAGKPDFAARSEARRGTAIFDERTGTVYKSLFMPMISDGAAGTPTGEGAVSRLLGRDIVGSWTSSAGSFDIVALGDGTDAQVEVTPGNAAVPNLILQLAPAARTEQGLTGALKRMGDTKPLATIGATYDRAADTVTFRTLQGASILSGVVTARRAAPKPGSPQPGSEVPQPLPTPAPSPAGPASSPTPGTGISFPSTGGLPGGPQTIDTFVVALANAAVTANGKVDVTLTVRNTGTDPQPIVGSLFHVMMVDQDGVGTESVAPLVPGEGPPRAFDERPVLAAGAQMSVRFQLTPFQGGAPIERLSVAVHLDQAATFPLTGLASPLLSRDGPGPRGGGFAALTDFEVAVDRVVAVGNATELFFTIRNPTNRRIQVSDTAFTFRAADRFGKVMESARDFWPARGSRSMAPLHSSVFIEPGGEAHVRTIIPGLIEGPVTITDWTVSHTAK